MSSSPPSATTTAYEFHYSDFEHNCTTQKELNLCYAQSRVPLQRLLVARRLAASPHEFDDPLAICTILSRDTEWTVRDAVASELGVLCRMKKWREEENARMLAMLVALCRDQQSVQVRISAANSLAMIHHPSRLSAWLALARDRDGKFRFAGATCLGRVVRSASLDAQSKSAVVGELSIMVAEDESFTVRKAALKALCGNGGGSNNALAIQAALEACKLAGADHAWPVRVACAECAALVAEMGANCSDLAQVLLRLVESDTNAFVRQAGRRNLGWFLASYASALLLPCFANLAKSEEEETRFLFAFYLPGVLRSLPAPERVSVWDDLLRTVFADVSNDISGRIRRSLAFSLHLLAQDIGQERALRDLFPAFTSFLRDMDDEEEVKLGAVTASSKFLRALPNESRAAAFALVGQCLAELNSKGSISLALSRDARLVLASDLVEFSQIMSEAETREFDDFFLTLARDEAQIVRERAMQCFGEIAPALGADTVEIVLAWSAHAHYSWRYLFCCAARSAQRGGNPDLFRKFLPALQTKLSEDPVVAVREEALKLI